MSREISIGKHFSIIRENNGGLFVKVDYPHDINIQANISADHIRNVLDDLENTCESCGNKSATEYDCDNVGLCCECR